MLNQICFTHRRLEQLLTTFTKKAESKFIKKMDEEFQKLQTEANHCFTRSMRIKEPFNTKELEAENGLLLIENKRLTQKLTALNEDYERQIEMSFELQDNLSTVEATMATLTEYQRVQQEKCDQMVELTSKQSCDMEEVRANLKSTQKQLATLKAQHKEQAEILATTQEELRIYHLKSQHTTPDTPKSEERTPHASGSNTQVNTSGLYSMIEGPLEPTIQNTQSLHYSKNSPTSSVSAMNFR